MNRLSLAIVAVLVFSAWGLAPGDDLQPFELGGGINRPASAESRTDTSDYGWGGLVGVSAPDGGLVGQGWLEFTYNRDQGNRSIIESYGVLYIERVPLSDLVYIGLGPGSYFNNVDVNVPGSPEVHDHNWRVGGKALIGLNLGSMFVEVAYQYSSTVSGISTSNGNLCIGLHF